MCNCNCGHKGMCTVSMVVKILLIVGGLNWGLVGIGMFIGSDLNIVGLILGSVPVVEAIVYVLVGVAAVVKLIGCKCAKCVSACTCDVGSKPEGRVSAGM